MIKDLILKNRTYRRFHQEIPVERDTLKELVDLARLAAYGRNRQALKYILSCEPEKNARIYTHIGLGGDPPEGDRPAAYIIILGDKEIIESFGCNQGIAAQNIMLGATEKGLGSCIIATIEREKLRETLAIPAQYDILLVVALGKSKETVVLETLAPGEDPAGYWDDKGVRHTPKRLLEDIIIG